MKKVVLSIAAMITLGFAANAQVSFIPKAGITLSNRAVKDKEEGQKSNMGMVAGLGINLPVSEGGFFSVQPELLYIQKGYKTEEDGESNKLYLNHLELPVLAKVSFGGESVKAYVNAGPSVGFNMGGKLKYEFENESESIKLRFGDKENTDETWYIDKEDYNRVDLGMQFGGGLALQAGPGSLILDARYGLGLSNFRKAPETIPSGMSKSDFKNQNRVFALSLGYAIPLGK
jgi:hypothetical protein